MFSSFTADHASDVSFVMILHTYGAGSTQMGLIIYLGLVVSCQSDFNSVNNKVKKQPIDLYLDSLWDI